MPERSENRRAHLIMSTSNGLLILAPRKQSKPAYFLLKRHVPPPFFVSEISDFGGPKSLGQEPHSIPNGLYSFGI